MPLIPDLIRQQIPAIYAQEKVPDAIVHVKLFMPDSSWTWYVTEIAEDGDEAFGLVVGFETELGYFSIREIESVRGPLGLPVERDLYFDPMPLSKVRAMHP